MNGPNNKIGWCSMTWNPVIGCSNNCPDCYARKMAKRLAAMGQTDYLAVLSAGGKKWNSVAIFRDSILDQPLHCKKPQRIFVTSMGDLLCKAVPSDWIQKIIDIAKHCPQHTFQFLTQNPTRYSEFNWPDNCWLGTTVRTQKEADERIPLLLLAKSKIKFLSVEPVLEEAMIICLKGVQFNKGVPKEYKIDWLIVGSATDARAKDCKLDWIESVVEQCKVANVPIWVKQIPLWKTYNDFYPSEGEAKKWCGTNCHPKLVVCKDINLFPKHLQLRQFPK